MTRTVWISVQDMACQDTRTLTKRWHTVALPSSLRLVMSERSRVSLPCCSKAPSAKTSTLRAPPAGSTYLLQNFAAEHDSSCIELEAWLTRFGVCAYGSGGEISYCFWADTLSMAVHREYTMGLDPARPTYRGVPNLIC